MSKATYTIEVDGKIGSLGGMVFDTPAEAIERARMYSNHQRYVMFIVIEHMTYSFRYIAHIYNGSLWRMVSHDEQD